jgi:hypothetical protein
MKILLTFSNPFLCSLSGGETWLLAAVLANGKDGGLEVIEHCTCITEDFYFARYAVPDDQVYLGMFQSVTLYAALRIRCIDDSRTEYNNDRLCHFRDLLTSSSDVFDLTHAHLSVRSPDNSN